MDMCEHGGYPDFCKHCTAQRIAELEQRVKELEAEITAWEELYKADQELSKEISNGTHGDT